MDLANALRNQGHDVDKKFISINGGNIKRLGQYEAVIRLHRSVTVDFIFEVIAEA
jgi:large subunit ribosomal protein L9